jgi:hypothetical protein
MIVAELRPANETQLRLLREQQPGTFIVLVTRMEVHNLLRLATVTVDAVADISQDPLAWLELVASLLDDRDHVARRDLIRRISSAPHLTEWLRTAAVRLAGAVPPLRTVTSLARSLKCSPSTLRKHYSRLESGWRLEDLVDWYVLLYYGWHVDLLDSHAVHSLCPPAQRTLDRMSLRLLGQRRSALRRPEIYDHPTVECLHISKGPLPSSFHPG